MLVVPSTFVDVISVTPAIRPKRRSSGVATDEAIVCGLAPGSPAVTLRVGKSTRGSGDTGSTKKAAAPESSIAAPTREVAIGRRMKGSERITAGPEPCAPAHDAPGD